jgi:photosystem II stability/assembly factor-like uncharacterized protein
LHQANSVLCNTATSILMNRYYWIISLAFIFSACGKDYNPPQNTGEPPGPDTLLSWTRLTPSIFSNAVNGNAFNDVYFTDAANGFLAATDGYLYKSLDSGKNWQRIPSVKINPLNIHFIDKITGFVQGGDSISFTFNGGQSWTTRNYAKAVVSGNDSLYSTHIWFTNASTGYITTGSGVYRTKDTCKTWQKIFSGQCWTICFIDNNNGRLNAADKMYKTSNAGDTWIPANINFASLSGHTIQYTGATTAYLSHADGLLKTTDDWLTSTYAFDKNINNKGESVFTRDIAFMNSTVGYMATPLAIFKTTDGGATWTRTLQLHPGNPGRIFELSFINENTGWACGDAGLLLRLKL